MTYAAADAKISCRFAPVKNARTSDNIKVNIKRIQIMRPVLEPSCDEWVKRNKIYTGSTRSAMIADRLMEEAMISRRLRE